MKERRASVRHKSFLQGRILFNQRRASVDCLIRDLSEAGARLKISDAIVTPDAVELYVPHKEEIRRALVQWRRGDEMGIEFPRAVAGEEPAAGQGAGDLEERLHRLETELAALRRLVNELKGELRHGDREAI